jgi:hypothetical protein
VTLVAGAGGREAARILLLRSLCVGFAFLARSVLARSALDFADAHDMTADAHDMNVMTSDAHDMNMR